MGFMRKSNSNLSVIVFDNCEGNVFEKGGLLGNLVNFSSFVASEIIRLFSDVKQKLLQKKIVR